MAPTRSALIKVYTGKAFKRFARKARITDADLWETAQLADRGQIDADLGGGVIKQRIARTGQGKSGGSRAIIVFRRSDRAVYIYGFEKKDTSNISSRELEAFRELAVVILGYTEAELAQRVDDGALVLIEAPEVSDAEEI